MSTEYKQLRFEVTGPGVIHIRASEILKTAKTKRHLDAIGEYESVILTNFNDGVGVVVSK